MAISDELSRLITAKAGIKSALEEKGLTIGDSSTLDEFPGLILEMEVGGGGSDTSTIIDLIEGDVSGNFVIPNGTTKIIDNAFYKQTNLTDVSIPNTVTSIGANAFGESGLQNSIIPSSVNQLGSSLFRSCAQLKNVNILGDASVGENIFYSCPKLLSIDISNLKECGLYLVLDCNSLTTIKMDSLENIAMGKSNVAIYRGNAIRYLYLPNAKNINRLLSQYVSGSGSDVTIHIGKRIEYINSMMESSNYLTVIIEAITPPTLAWRLTNYQNKIRNIYVPGESVDSYKNAGGNWNDVSNYITPLAAMNYDSTTYTVTASGRDNLELYVDASLINSSVYTFDSTTLTGNHTVTVKSVDPSLGVLDTVSLEIQIAGLLTPSATPTIRFEEEEIEQEVIDEATGEPTGETETVGTGNFRAIGEISNGGTQYVTLNVNDNPDNNPTGYDFMDSYETTANDPDITITIIATATEPGKSATSITKYYTEITPEEGE